MMHIDAKIPLPNNPNRHTASRQERFDNRLNTNLTALEELNSLTAFYYLSQCNSRI